MEGILSKRTRGVHPNGKEVTVDIGLTEINFEVDLNEINFRVAFESLTFDDLTEFTGLPLETDDEAAKIVIECKKRTWRNRKLSRTFQAYFDITSELLKSLSPPSNQLLLSTTHESEGEEEESKQLKDFIDDYRSLEQRLLTQNTRIRPMKRIYEVLQFVAVFFRRAPYIGPVTLASIIGGKPHPAAAAVLTSVAFVACGGIGKWGLTFCKSQMKALRVQKEVIGLMLMSIAFHTKDLGSVSHQLLNKGMSMHDDNVNKTVCHLEKRLRNDRKIILQKITEYENSAASADDA